MENQVYLTNLQEFFDMIKKNKYDELKALFQDEKHSPWLYKDDEGFSGILKSNKEDFTRLFSWNFQN
jgi:hypothetical protein